MSDLLLCNRCVHEFEDGEKAYTTRCGHIFCENSILHWIQCRSCLLQCALMCSLHYSSLHHVSFVSLSSSLNNRQQVCHPFFCWWNESLPSVWGSHEQRYASSNLSSPWIHGTEDCCSENVWAASIHDSVHVPWGNQFLQRSANNDLQPQAGLGCQ